MILYVTYNDPPSGVYWSQVTDVVDHLSNMEGDHVRLVAMVSMRRFPHSYRAIRKRVPDAIVLPIIPRAHRWRNSGIWLRVLCRWLRPHGIMARGVFATALSIRMREKGLVRSVCFDARAAYGAEWEEFRVVDDDALIAECAELERDVVNMADVRIAVSKALVEHWRKRANYTGSHHWVIPCTLAGSAGANDPRDRATVRSRYGWQSDDLVLAYAGTVVGWQSMELLYRTIEPWLASNASHRILFLSGDHPVIGRLTERFPEQVAREWVAPEEVHGMLQACDHGLLLRDPCVTNQVASPTKFAEYLNAGLPVIISESVGDLSQLVESEDLGVVLGSGGSIDMGVPDQARRERMIRMARTHFTKEVYNEGYAGIKACLGPAPVEWPTGTGDENGPMVSIIVPSFNKRPFLMDMITSVREQTDQRWELIVVDDASSDGSPELLQAIEAEDPRIRIIALPTNKGANFCRNQGVQAARGRYVIFLDADDILATHCVAERVKVMKDSGLDLAVFTMEVFRKTPGDHGQRWVPDAQRPLADFFRHDLPWQTMQPIWEREFLIRIGGFDEDFSRHQDVELHTRALLQKGVKLRVHPGTPDCYYRIDDERKVIGAQALMERFCRSAVRFRNKFQPAARERGMEHLLLGIIFRTYLQVILNARSGGIDRNALNSLEAILLDEDPFPVTGWKRVLFRLVRRYNSLPFRIPGVNLMFFTLITGRGL